MDFLWAMDSMVFYGFPLVPGEFLWLSRDFLGFYGFLGICVSSQRISLPYFIVFFSYL